MNTLRSPAPLVCLSLFIGLALTTLGAAQTPQKKKEDAEERKLRNEIKERDQTIQKLRKELEEQKAEHKKLNGELDAWKKKPVVPNDNVALAAYDASGLFAKEPPAGTGPVVLECRKATTLLLVWKHSGSKDSKGTKWEYATVKLMPDTTHEVRLNLHKGDWTVYRSNPKAGYVHLGEIKVADRAATLNIPDMN